MFFPLIFTLKWKLESVPSMQVTALISFSAHQSNSLVPVEVPLRPRHPHPASACFDKGQSRSTAPPSTHGCSGIKARNRWSLQPEELGSQSSLRGEGGEEESRLLRDDFHPPPSYFSRPEQRPELRRPSGCFKPQEVVVGMRVDWAGGVLMYERCWGRFSERSLESDKSHKS